MTKWFNLALIRCHSPSSHQGVCGESIRGLMSGSGGTALGEEITKHNTYVCGLESRCLCPPL